MTSKTPPGPRAPILGRATHESGVVVVSITGELDTAGTRQIEPAFQAALPDRTVDAVLDLAGVPFLTSAALAMIVVKAQAMKRAGGALHLAAATRIVDEVFQRAGFTNIFTLYSTVDEAIKAISADKPTAPPVKPDKPLAFS